jgi:hypothetical protein
MQSPCKMWQKQKNKKKIFSFTKKKKSLLNWGESNPTIQFYLFFHWNPYSTPYSNSFIQIPTFIVWDQNECNSTRIIVCMQLQVKVSKISSKWSFIVHCHIHTLTIFIWIKNLDLLSLCMF